MKNCLTIIALFFSLHLSAQDQFSIVFLNKKADAEKISDEERNKIMEGHLAHHEKLAKEGRLIAAGPFEGGGGIMVLKTKDVDQAKEWISTDPGVIAKRWNIEVLPLIPRQGSICSANPPYEMVNYSFFRFNVIVSKFNADDFPRIIMQHDHYLKGIGHFGSILLDAMFSEWDGGIVIMKGEIAPEVFEKDPGVTAGLIELDTKKLFIAKGSFCEK